MLKQTTNHTNLFLFVCPRMFRYLFHVDKALWKQQTHVCHLAVHNL